MDCGALLCNAHNDKWAESQILVSCVRFGANAEKTNLDKARHLSIEVFTKETSRCLFASSFKD